MSKKSTPEYVKEIRRNQYSMDGNIEKIFSECEITSYPINVFQIARKLEFDIIYGKFKQDNVYGVMWDGDEPLNVGGKQMYRAILLNKQDSLERQAFTVHMKSVILCFIVRIIQIFMNGIMAVQSRQTVKS